jgi:hypothetical protein
MPAYIHAFDDGTTFRYPTVEAPKRAVSREVYMSPDPGNEKPYLRDHSGVRRAAMVVIDELGEDAAEYAVTRAMVLQRRGDEIGASTWRRVAPVIEELQRRKGAGSN